MAADSLRDVEAYAAAVREALSDLTPGELADLTEDLDDHLREVSAEGGAPLPERLGAPRQYAAELRAAYGVELGRPRKPWQGLLRQIQVAYRSSLPARTLGGLAPELRPTWWVLRGAIVPIILAFAINRDAARLIPNPVTSRGLLEWVAIAGGVVLSIRLGRSGRPRQPILRGIFGAGNLALAMVAVGVLWEMSNGAVVVQDLGSAPLYGAVDPAVTNIYPFSASGQPLNGVLLYDQNGNPVIVGAKGDPLAVYPRDAKGDGVPNEYPHSALNPDGTPQTRPQVSIPAPAPSPAPSPAAGPSPSPTP